AAMRFSKFRRSDLSTNPRPEIPTPTRMPTISARKTAEREAMWYRRSSTGSEGSRRLDELIETLDGRVRGTTARPHRHGRPVGALAAQADLDVGLRPEQVPAPALV